MITVPWNSPNFPLIYTRSTSDSATNVDACGLSPIAVVVALCNSNSSYYDHSNSSLPHHHKPYPDLAGFVNGCLLYSVLSAGNTALYVASRTLYGLASSPRLRARGYFGMLIRSLGTTNPRTGVPVYAVVFSWLILCWVPLLAFHDEPWRVLDGVSAKQSKGKDIKLILLQIKQFLFVTSSMAYVVVWAVLCLAFIRFRNWYVSWRGLFFPPVPIELLV